MVVISINGSNYSSNYGGSKKISYELSCGLLLYLVAVSLEIRWPIKPENSIKFGLWQLCIKPSKWLPRCLPTRQHTFFYLSMIYYMLNMNQHDEVNIIKLILVMMVFFAWNNPFARMHVTPCSMVHLISDILNIY